MKKIYIAYKFSGADHRKLRKKLENISDIIKRTGYKSFIFFRDIQKWKVRKENPVFVMRKAFTNLKKCDILLAIVETREKAEGLLIESGYAKSLGKKIIVALTPQGRAILLRGIADKSFIFRNMKEFEKNLGRILE